MTKTDFDTKLKKVSDRVTSNKINNLLLENEIKNLSNFDAAYFRGKNYFDDDGTQNYSIFQPVYKYFEISSGKITSWESRGLSNEKNSFSHRLINTQPPIPAYDNARIKVKSNGDFLKQDKITCNHGPIVNIYVVYRLTPYTKDSSVTLQNCLFGAVKLTKNADIGKYKYSGYGIGFYSSGSFSHPSEGYGRNVIIFGADLNSSLHANNKTRSILVLGKDFIQGTDGTAIYTEKMYSTNYTADNKIVIIAIYLSMEKKLLILKQKTLKFCHIHYA